MKIFILLVSLIISIEAYSSKSKSTETSLTNETDSLIAFKRNAIIGRGINFGNALEAPNEGDWGLTIKESYIQEVKDAGFNSVRLPICWSAHTSYSVPYSIDATFLKRVDTIVNWCTIRGLAVIITIHHFNDFYDNPDNENYKSMFTAIWQQLSTHYKSYSPEKLFFEVLNEPHSNLTADKWNALIPSIIETIRKADTERTLIIDVPDYGYHESISKLIIPESEINVIVSVRYYLPYQFTHQGAHWAEGSDKWLGTTWSATSEQKNTVETDIQKIQTWSKLHNRPVTIGEFGAIMHADATNRLIWTDYVTRSFESHNFSWSYFDFGVIFKAFDIEKNVWLKGFREALIHNTTTQVEKNKADRSFYKLRSDGIYFNSAEETTVSMYSIEGQLLSASSFCDDQLKWGPSIHPGIYVIRIQRERQTFEGKLIVLK